MTIQLLPGATEARAGEKLGFAILNDGSSHIEFGLPYLLERDDDGEWIRCNVEQAWVLPAYRLGPGERREENALIPEDALPGRYRVRKKIRHDLGPDEVVTFEFKVVEP